ncbi:MAG: hypothetical protein COB02_05245 [Candidatus Cloacimonadota bacterium]|nr:MAG: hypothetical protein COB02_05245 [Candidatus Cloacimonadota bacterium]
MIKWFLFSFLLFIYSYESSDLQDALLKVSNSINKRYNYGSNKKVMDQIKSTDNVTIFTQEDIQKYDNLYALLNTAAGVIVDEGYFGKSYISIRSSTGSLYNSRIQLIVNGFLLNDSLNQEFILQSIPKESIEKIELIRGPSSALYGSGAYSGVINIITFKAKKYDLNTIQISKGNSGTQNLRAKLSNSTNKLHTMFAFNISQENGNDRNQGFIIPNSNRRPAPPRRPNIINPVQANNQKPSYQQNDKVNSMIAFLSYKNFEVTLGANNFESKNSYFSPRPFQFNNINIQQNDTIKETSIYDMKFIGVHWGHLFNPNFKVKITSKVQQNSSDITSINRISSISNSKSTEKQIDLQFSKQFSKKIDLIFGVHKNFNKFSQSISGVSQNISSHFNIPSTKDKQSGFYLQSSFQYNDKLNFIVSNRYNRHKLLNNYQSPKLSISYQLKQQEYLKFSWGKAFRYLNGIELFQSLNQQLDSRFEKELSKELTWVKKYNNFKNLSLTYFQVKHLHNRSKLRILRLNQRAESQIKGIEAEFKSKLNKDNNYYLNLTLLSTGNTEASLSKMLSFGLEFKLLKKYSFHLDSKYTGSRSDNISKFGGFTIHHLNIQKKLKKKSSIKLQISNLTNKKYPSTIIEPIGFKVPSPSKGRRVLLSYNLKF